MLSLICRNPLWLVLWLCVDTVYLSGDVSTRGYKNKSTCRCCLILSSFLVAHCCWMCLKLMRSDAVLYLGQKNGACTLVYNQGIHLIFQINFIPLIFTLNTEVTFYLWKFESDVLVESHYLSPKMRFDHIRKAKLKCVILSVVPYFHMQNV